MDLFFCSPQLDTISNTRSQIKIKIPFFERDKNLTLSLLYIQLKVLPLIKEVLYSSKRASGICRSRTGCSEGSETSWFCKPYHAPEQSAWYTIKEGDALLSRPKNAQNITYIYIYIYIYIYEPKQYIYILTKYYDIIIIIIITNCNWVFTRWQ